VNKTQAFTLIKQQLGFHKSLNADIMNANLDMVQETYERGHSNLPLPWFLFNSDFLVSLAAEQKVVQLPGNFLGFDEEWPLSVQAIGGERMMVIIDSYRAIGQYYDIGGEPCSCTYDGETLRFAPYPLIDYTLYIPHFASSGPISEVDTHPWLTYFGPLMVYETAYLIADAKRDIEGARRIDNRLQLLRSEYAIVCESKQHEHRSYPLGGL
jgi:hypothetical protein